MNNGNKGQGILSLEENIDKEKPILLLIFRNKLGKVIFQGQLMKNVSKFTKKNPPKPGKIQRMINVIEKKDTGKVGILKCKISFANEEDCLKFKEIFNKKLAELPEVIKLIPKDKK